MAQYEERGEFTVALGNGSQQRGEDNAIGPTYRNAASKDGFVEKPGINTLFDLFENSVNKHGARKCLGWRPMKNGKAGDFQWLTYKETQGLAGQIASGLATLGLKKGGKAGIYSINCPEFMISIQACNRGGLALVPLYDSLGEEAVEYTVNHSQTQLIFLQASKLPQLNKALSAIKKNVQTVVYWGQADQGELSTLKQQIKVVTWDELLAVGKGKPAQASPPSADDTACIMYTSGTTGNPKGVVLTHRNVVAAVVGLQTYVSQGQIQVNDNDSLLSFLTMAHIFGRVTEEFALSCGAAIGYWQGDVKKLTDDIAALKPTVFAAVPRVLERIQSGIVTKIKARGALTGFILGLAFRFKIWRLHCGASAYTAAPWLDGILFSKFRQAFGGRVRFIVSGGAPLATHIEEYLAVALCCPVFQGYGLTETCAASFLALPHGGMSGTVGPPVSSLELRLEGNAELGYDPHGEPPRGEICVRGPTVFTGYYQDKKKTDESFDSDGYFHSGDVGEITPSGSLKVIDRLKNMFKLAQGEYIAAEKLELAYSEASTVEQVWVYGNSYESTLVAVVVPQHHELTAWAKQNGQSSSFEEAVKTPEARKHVLDDLNKAGKAARLRGFERISAVWLDSEPFSVDNDLMTPSFKLKRPQLQKHYQKHIDDMYKSGKK